MKPFYLFLDFDGVLHSEGPDATDLFVHADRLGSLLATFPHVQVVISSMWREVHHITTLRALCGSALGPRIVHVTPVLIEGRFYIGLKNEQRLWADYRGAHLLQTSDESFGIDAQHVRFMEIAMWLAVLASDTRSTPATIGADALSRDDWIALDDSDFWFPPECRQLIHVVDGLGLDDAHFAELEARLLDHRRISSNVP